MTSRTFTSQLSPVNVVEGVTIVAGRRRGVLHPGLVAGGAILPSVSPEKRKTRCSVLEAGSGPAGGIVAAGAIRPEPALVRVIGPVAGCATDGEIVPVVGPCMTVRTLELRMAVLQCKTGDARMIESGAPPCIGRVATAAVRSALARVHIVHRVAAGACRCRLVETVALVTIPARNLLVHAGQRITHKRVVEYRILPVRL